jgi:aminoglycoside phosphotransferase (APT) family kinase protein
VYGLDDRRVSDWLVSNVDGVQPPFEFENIVGGRSNLTYVVTDAAGSRLIVRRPPTGLVLATAHDMTREHRIISAVGQTSVPVPKTFGLCEDESIIGAPFYVMEFVAGRVLDAPETVIDVNEAVRAAASQHLVEVLADLHSVDVDEIGLGDLARRGGYIERQIKRWSTQWENSRTRDLPAIDEIARYLAANVPEQIGVSIAHGDYRFGNVLADVTVGRITAVLDWELCTLGDPLADLGYLGVYWSGPEREPRHNDPTSLPGFPTFDEIVARYADLTGRDVSNIGYYVAFSAWKLAVISEGVYARYQAGAMGESDDREVADQFRVATEDLARDALLAVGRAS